MKTETQLRKAIMRRVYGIYVLRQIMRPGFRLGLVAAICLVISSSVSMPNVIANATHTGNLAAFALSAISHTTPLVQLGVLLAGLVIIWTAVDAFRPRSGSYV